MEIINMMLMIDTKIPNNIGSALIFTVLVLGFISYIGNKFLDRK